MAPPEEHNSQKKVPQVVIRKVKEPERRDPRFIDVCCGKFRAEKFRSDYAFLDKADQEYADRATEELRELKEAKKYGEGISEEEEERLAELQTYLYQHKAKKTQLEIKRRQDKRIRAAQLEERKAVKEGGKKAFFMKKTVKDRIKDEVRLEVLREKKGGRSKARPLLKFDKQ